MAVYVDTGLGEELGQVCGLSLRNIKGKLVMVKSTASG